MYFLRHRILAFRINILSYSIFSEKIQTRPRKNMNENVSINEKGISFVI